MLMLLNAIPKWLYVAVIAAFAATSCKMKISLDWLTLEVEKSKVLVSQAQAEISKVKAEHMTLVASSEAQFSKSLEAQRSKEAALQLAMDTQRRKFNETTLALNNERNAMRVRFAGLQREFSLTSNSAPRPATAIPTETRQVGGFDLDSELSGPIGDIIDEATRADTIREALISCYATYDQVQNINGVTK